MSGFVSAHRGKRAVDDTKRAGVLPLHYSTNQWVDLRFVSEDRMTVRTPTTAVRLFGGISRHAPCLSDLSKPDTMFYTERYTYINIREMQKQDHHHRHHC